MYRWIKKNLTCFFSVFINYISILVQGNSYFRLQFLADSSIIGLKMKLTKQVISILY